MPTCKSTVHATQQMTLRGTPSDLHVVNIHDIPSVRNFSDLDLNQLAANSAHTDKKPMQNLETKVLGASTDSKKTIRGGTQRLSAKMAAAKLLIGDSNDDTTHDRKATPPGSMPPLASDGREDGAKALSVPSPTNAVSTEDGLNLDELENLWEEAVRAHHRLQKLQVPSACGSIYTPGQ